MTIDNRYHILIYATCMCSLQACYYDYSIVIVLWTCKFKAVLRGNCKTTMCKPALNFSVDDNLTTVEYNYDNMIRPVGCICDN